MNHYKIHRQFDALGDYCHLRQASHKEDQNSKKNARLYSRKGQKWQDQSKEEGWQGDLEKFRQKDAVETPS